MTVKPTMLLAAAVVAFGLPASALACGMHTAQLDQKVTSAESDLTDQQLAEVKVLRDVYDQAHNSGRDVDAAEVLAKAEAILDQR